MQSLGQEGMARLAAVATATLIAAGVPVTWADSSPSPRPARLAVESEPQGAVVYIDGQLVGVTPLAVEGIAVGDHAVRLVRDGFLENSRLVTVPSSGALLHVDLTPAVALPAGSPLSARPGSTQGGGEADSGQRKKGKRRTWRLVGIGAAAIGTSYLGYKVLTRNTGPTVAGVVADPSTALQGATSVSFSVSASDKDGDALSYSWDFGDGATATGPNPSHVYASAGSYEATVQVSDGKKTAAGSTALTVKSMAGRWTGRLDGTSPITFILAQDGSGVAGSYQAVYPGAKAVAGPVAGSVTAPRTVTMKARVPNYWPLTYEATLDPSLDSMVGTASENGVPYPFQLARQ